MAAQHALMSPSDYLTRELASPVRHEYVAGSVYAMSGASQNHIEITRSLSAILYQATEEGPCRNLDQDAKIWVEWASAYYYADASISCPPRYIDSANGVIDNPTVLFEVISPSSASLDRGSKFATYRSLESLRDYVLVESDSASVEVYSLEGDEWIVRTFAGSQAIAVLPSLGIQIPLDKLYRHVLFSA